MQPSQGRRRTTITAATGTWVLGKTIGAGSMGKVKLAKNTETGEQVRLMAFFPNLPYLALISCATGCYQDRAPASPPTSTERRRTETEPTTPKRFGRLGRQPS